MFFRNSPEYEARLKKPFAPPTVTLKQIHDAVPKHLLQKNPAIATLYVIRDITLALLLYKFAASISPLVTSDFGGHISGTWKKNVLKSAMWLTYWWVQGMVGAGIFCLGHEAGHQTLYNSKTINNIIGFILHSYLLIPYYAWRTTHHAHHKATANIERDENYIPHTRSSLKLPEEKKAVKADYTEMFEETPIYTLFRLFIMQGCGWWLYLTQNTLGSAMYPPGTNHFSPKSPLFKPEQGNSIILSDIGIGAMACFLVYLGPNFFFSYYLIPYLFVNHWIVMFTFLHHSDPTIPIYRKEAWTFLRGASSTVDRPLLGWMGRFFFHNISHDHVAHHFFLRAPFYNGPEITKAIKTVLKDSYNYDSTPTFYALYRSFTQCLFIEDVGDIVFYKNKDGVAARELARSAVTDIKNSEQNVADEQEDMQTEKLLVT